MFDVYTLFKFIHVVAAILWVGGVGSIVVLDALAGRQRDPSQSFDLAKLSQALGRTLLGPAAGLTLAAGIVMVAVSGLGAPFWVMWGLAMVIASILVGATLSRRATSQYLSVGATAAANDPRLLTLRRRLSTTSLINLLLLLSAVWAMVFKPTL